MSTEYKLISETGPVSLESTVNIMISEGWQPLGAPQIVISHWKSESGPVETRITEFSGEYYQAMTRTKIEAVNLMESDANLARAIGLAEAMT